MNKSFGGSLALPETEGSGTAKVYSTVGSVANSLADSAIGGPPLCHLLWSQPTNDKNREPSPCTTSTSAAKSR
ncbi:hypothetical protein [Spongiibacter marinus]|uniref:hypothetical protein n=1 Tax=Spongiibacter marinus TaxID=354246 RepID=UPI0035BE4FE2